MKVRVIMGFFIFFHATSLSMKTGHDLSINDFKLLIPKKEIKERTKQMASKVSQDYSNQRIQGITIVMVMKGALHVVSDLSRALDIPSTLDFVQASSYGQNGTVSGQLSVMGLERLELAGKHVLLVDDIFDTGKTIGALKQELLKKNPASLKTLVLLLKDKPRETKELPDYHLFLIKNQFVIGYGLDYKEKFRDLPDIWVKKD